MQTGAGTVEGIVPHIAVREGGNESNLPPRLRKLCEYGIGLMNVYVLKRRHTNINEIYRSIN